MRFLFVNLSASVTADQIARIGRACEVACNAAPFAFCEQWGIDRICVETEGDPTTMPDAVIVKFVDADAGDGTLAFHAEVRGQAVIEVDVQSILRFGGDVLTDKGTNLSVAAATMHEVFETLVDRFANGYVQQPDGTFLADEVSDPVEAFKIMVPIEDGTVVHGADAVLPAYFVEDADGPYDLAGAVGEPFENDGYQITVPAGGAPGAVIAHEKYTANAYAYRKARIEAGRGRGVSRVQ